ncbi:unnamed protein product [Symbiodinium natans]|uniref:Uncharacterized protein n=1 Tax=Symbiodinium natans TaxID=878477 RepID=A0A812R3P3_9DINO|nr:unnamed protein product [Symbiodinium natans]
MELEDLRPAYKDAVDERISIQSRLEEVTGKLSKAEDIARGTSQQLSAVQAENRELQKQVKQLQAVRRAARVARQRSPITWPAFDDALPGEVAERDGHRKADAGIGDDAEDICESRKACELGIATTGLRSQRQKQATTFVEAAGVSGDQSRASIDIGPLCCTAG